MNQPFSWSELFLQDPSINYARIFSCWPHLAFGRIRPIGLSAFGDCYFERDDGTVQVLDPLEGQVRQVAGSTDEFTEKINSPQWRDENLMPEFLAQIVARGLARASNQVVGFAPHPAITGKLSPEQAVSLDPVVWHSIASQILTGAASQPRP